MSIENPLITIVIPHFNRETIILNAIKSIRNQLYTNWQCFIVDDGSDHESYKRLENELLTAGDERFNLLLRPADRLKGANACRNYGIEKGKGVYIALLDSDDSWPQDYLLETVFFVGTVQHFYGCYAGAIEYRDQKVKTLESRPIKKDEGLFEFLLTPGVIAQTSSFFLKKEYALKVRFDENLKRHQDYDFFIRFGRKYTWSFNNRTRAIVDWNTIKSRSVHFESCIKVYRQHIGEFTNERTRYGYLFSMYSLACYNKAPVKILNFYRSEIFKTRVKKSIGEIAFLVSPKINSLYKKLFVSQTSV